MSKAVESLNNNGGFLLADGTGVGKTTEALAVAKIMADQGKKVMIVTAAEAMKPDWAKGTFSGSWKDDSTRMNVPVQLDKGDLPLEAGKINLTTYDRLGKIKDKIDAGTTLIYDESHALKNWGSARSKHGAEMSKNAGQVMFMTATPLDKPTHLPYLQRAKVFGGGSWDQTYNELGLIKKQIPIGRGQTVTKWEVNPRVGAVEVQRRLSGLFDKMTEEGLMLKREISFDGVHVGIQHVELPKEAHDMLAKIDEEVKANVDNPGLQKALSLMHQRRQLEPYKIPAAVDYVKKELGEGRQVVVFVSRVNESEVTGKKGAAGEAESIAKSEGTAKSLVQKLNEAGIHDVAEIHGGARTKPDKAMKDFQSGKARVVVATVESGGTGINLDDTKGDKPRSLLMLTPPFSAVQNVQAAGRVWRLNTKSSPRIHYLMTDTDVDRWNGALIANKMKSLGAAVSGSAANELNLEKPVEDEDVPEVKKDKYKWSRSLTGRQAVALGPVATKTATSPESVAKATPVAVRPEAAAPPKKVQVRGDTYQHKDKIKAAGGRWNPDKKSWEMDARDAEKVKHLPGLTVDGAAASSTGEKPKTYLVTGNTYAHKDRIKAAGGRWDSARSGWVVPEHSKAAIEHLSGLRFTDQSEPRAVPQTAPMTAVPQMPSVSHEAKSAVHQAVKHLAGMDADRASERNSVGFNKMDSDFGASLAEQTELTDRQALAAARMLAKYKRQLPDELYKHVSALANNRLAANDWSDAAREAALEARRRKMRPQDDQRPIVTDSAEVAARALAMGKKVELNQPRQVSTLLDKLQAMVKDAEAKGEKAPTYDLCNVSVKGTNLFCAESLGVPRIKMPQLRGVPEPGSLADRFSTLYGGKDAKGKVTLQPAFVANLLVDNLRQQGVTVHDDYEDAAHLRASQNQLDGVKAARMLKRARQGEAQEPIVISRDNYIVDGHHHWAGMVAHELERGGKGLRVPVRRVDMGITELLDRANKFAAKMGMKSESVTGNANPEGHNQYTKGTAHRELHDMTREEFFNDPELVRQHIPEGRGGYRVTYSYIDPAGTGPFHGSHIQDEKPRKGETVRAMFGLAKVTAVSRAKPRALDNMQLFQGGKRAHREAVESALQAGKKIRPEVLADYPDLRPPAANELGSGIERWITVQGQHIPIKEGGNVGDTIREHFAKLREAGNKPEEGHHESAGHEGAESVPGHVGKAKRLAADAADLAELEDVGEGGEALEHIGHLGHEGHEAHEVIEHFEHALGELFGGGEAHEHIQEASHAMSGAGEAAEASEAGTAESIIGRHLMPHAIKGAAKLLEKAGAVRTGKAVAAIWDRQDHLADKLIHKLEHRYGKGNAGAILGAGALSAGSALHALGPAGKLIPGKWQALAGSIPYAITAEVGHRIGTLTGKHLGAYTDRGFGRVGAWIHSIQHAVKHGIHKAVEPFAEAARIAGSDLRGTLATHAAQDDAVTMAPAELKAAWDEYLREMVENLATQINAHEDDLAAASKGQK